MELSLQDPLHIRTPLWESVPLRKASGKQLYLKMDCFQPTGSFKNRGVAKLCQHYAREGKTHLVSSSGGNAGYTTAYAGRKMGVKVTVFVPTTTKPLLIEKIKSQGGSVHIYGDSIDEAKTKALELTQSDPTAAFIPPFDHPTIWDGNATLIDEIKHQMPTKPDAILATVGGGGLACGILQGLYKHGWDDIPLYGVETQGAASMAASLSAGKLVTLEKIDTIAVTLGLKTITEKLLQWSKIHPITPITVSDQQAVSATKRFLDDHRILLEPACAAAFVPIYENFQQLEGIETLLVIVCGGIGINYDLLTEYLATV